MPNEKQLTAVQMLIEELEQLKPLSKLISNDVVKGLDVAIEQCKMKLATERQQLIDAVDGFPLHCRNLSGKDYYTQTFKTQ